MIFQFHYAEIGPDIVSSWFNFALTWSKEQHVGSSRLQVGPKSAQAASKLTQSWFKLLPGCVNLNENPAGCFLLQGGPLGSSQGVQGGIEAAPKMH